METAVRMEGGRSSADRCIGFGALAPVRAAM